MSPSLNGDSKEKRSNIKSVERLMSAAIVLFKAKGVDGTSVREIADLAEVNPSLINYHFGGKEGLYYHILENLGREELKIFELVLSAPRDISDFRSKLIMFIEQFIALHCKRPEIFVLLERFFERLDEKGEEIFQETFMRIFKNLIQFLESAQERGFANPKLNAMHIAVLLNGALGQIYRFNHCHEHFFGINYRQEDNAKALANSIIELFLSGLFVEPPSGSH